MLLDPPFDISAKKSNGAIQPNAWDFTRRGPVIDGVGPEAQPSGYLRGN